MAGIPIYDDTGNIVGYQQSVGTTGTSTANTSQPAYQFTWQNFQNDPLNFLGNGLKSIFTPMGSGDNAQSAGQLGLGLASTLYGGYLQKKINKDQLAEARKQFEFSKANTQANFMNQGTNFINQGLWQIEALNAFNPTAAAERAQNFNSAVNQMNTAANSIGLNNAFSQQQNSLQKYTQLADDGPRMA